MAKLKRVSLLALSLLLMLLGSVALARAQTTPVEIKLEDLSRHYDDETERWLYVKLNVAS